MFLSNMVLYKFNVHTAIASLESGNKQNKTKKEGRIVYEAYKGIYSSIWVIGNLIIPHTGQNAAAAAKSLQSCPTLCDPIDGSLSGSPVPGILQARTLEWGAIAFSTRPNLGPC